MSASTDPGSDTSVSASSSKELSEVALPVAESAPSEPEEVEYPDRLWTAPSVAHGDAVVQAKSAMDFYFRGRHDVLVARELVVYYERGNNKAWIQPDVQVAFGVKGPFGDRETFNVWEEGKAPDFVLEVASPSTAKNDALQAARGYARIGVREYWQLDPTGTTTMPLEGYDTGDGKCDRVESVEHSCGVRHLRSKVLLLDLRSEMQDGVTVLFVRDPWAKEDFDGTLQSARKIFDLRRRGRR